MFRSDTFNKSQTVYSSDIYNIFSKLIVNPTNVSNVLGRNTEDAPYLEELQNIIESEFIPRINTSISKIENITNQDYNFIISGEMQGDIYQDDIEMDDTEFYLIKAYMHFYNALFHIITTYDISEIAVDIDDYTVLNKDHPFLTIREGRESYMPFAYQQLNDLYASLDNSFDHLINETDWQENDYIQNDISDDNYNEIVENLETLEDCLDGECIESMEGCDDWECSFEYDGYWKDYDCDCIGEPVEMENLINLSNFMNNPPYNLKEYIPDYAVTTDECTFGSGVNSGDSNPNIYPCWQLTWSASTYDHWVADWTGDNVIINIDSDMGISSLSIAFDGDPFYWNEYGYYVRTFNSITINSIYGNTTITRPDRWDEMTSQAYNFPQQDASIPDWIDQDNLRNPMAWHLVSMGSGDLFYLFASDENSEIYSLLYSDNYWGMDSNNTFSDHWIDFTTTGSVLFSYNGTAAALTQEPMDITINGLYPEMTIEAILLLYQNLFNIDENNWKQTIGGD